MNLGYFIANAAARYPQTTAVVDDSGRWTYFQLQDRCARLAGAMLAWGLRPGDRVALLFYNTIHMVETYFACVRVGLVATPVNFRLMGEEMAYILNDSGARALFYGPEFQEQVQEVTDKVDRLELLVSPKAMSGSQVKDYEAFLAQGSFRDNASQIDENHPCQIMYTSGTTGRPKGAVITHRNVMWNLINTMHGRDDHAGQISIIVGPLYHTAALNNHLTIQIALGGTSVLVKKFDPESLLKIIEAEKATVISGSPAMYNLLMAHPQSHAYDTASITKCTSGADKLSMETKKRLMEFFPNTSGVYDVYGCTEASPCITILNAADSLRKDFCVGPALPFLQAQVVDQAGQPLPPGQVGELVCRGPNVMDGYHNNPQATSEALKDGWLHTGDLARTDDEGFFYIVDRTKDMVVSGGENIYPREVEEVLYTHPDVIDAAVVGVPDPTWGERVLAVVVKKPGSSLDAEGVIEFCKQHVAGYKKPRRVEFVAELPRNPSGKVLKRELRRNYA